MHCTECGGTEDVRLLTVLPLSMEEEVEEIPICFACLVEKGLHCDKHGIHISVYDDDEPDGVYSACPGCALEIMSEMEQKNIERCVSLAKEYLFGDPIKYITTFGTYGADEDQKIIIGLCLIGQFSGQKPEEALADMISHRQNIPMQ